MDAALAEAARVAPLVYVQEPLAQGPFFDLVALVDDETRVRALAQEAIARSPLIVERELRFDVPVRIRGIDDLRERIVGADPARADVFAAREDELRAGLVRARRGHQRAKRRARAAPRLTIWRTSPSSSGRRAHSEANSAPKTSTSAAA